ncbi:hypothetical protein SAMN06265222_102234 [Neorhodopirellula lusitana]|uniref:Uncharacterized protein n=1 Tax=Neorhodopirellula lusitana TaxID=445327 RepID=A0ABY1PU51_9BACT|nr:hypothetical protein SAMN06265222_102234 [Neorhodopirellula lusitana]
MNWASSTGLYRTGMHCTARGCTDSTELQGHPTTISAGENPPQHSLAPSLNQSLSELQQVVQRPRASVPKRRSLIP